ncbi:bifunctional phosphoserine phosphatase/homoserine phosphotransferase ThrH [uncultured Deefgea sp.]|uniref:bifunctional phosphoserine phosphatase/homoserine phosphotransferase ThrH n=1 Tax=uncultured Deefgea sp. TaxID=1304914 RepID=UPI00261A77A9|nr:bifunctional phosphoserine phosphatase/homoserine phosphotransferase ThrH [uncultured Deefgea sp.]
MKIACIDMEGVLAPEMWPYIGRIAKIDELNITTREEPDYLRLMQLRISLLKKHGLKLTDIQDIVTNMPLLEGASDFIAQLHKNFRVIIISDAFIELIDHFVQQLGHPEVECHRLICDSDGFIERCHFLARKGKEESVAKFQTSGCQVLAVGDAFNDLAMLRTAEMGLLFQPSEQTQQAAPDLQVVRSYAEVLQLIPTLNASLIA